MSLNIPLQPYGTNFAKLQWSIVITHVLQSKFECHVENKYWFINARNASRIDQTNAEWEFQLPYFCLVHYVISDSLIAMDSQYE